MVAGEEEIPHGGEFISLNPYSQIVFTWESPFSMEGSTVTVTLKEVAAGIHVDLNHVQFPSEESRSNHEAGWTAILKCLEALF